MGHQNKLDDITNLGADGARAVRRRLVRRAEQVRKTLCQRACVEDIGPYAKCTRPQPDAAGAPQAVDWAFV